MGHDVFISYSNQNIEAAHAVCHVLEHNEIRCWMAPRNIPPGSDYGDVIEDAIKACKAVVVLFSETAARSQYVKSEINIAFEEQKTIIPFRLDKTPLKGQNRLILNKIHWIDAYPDYKTKFNDLVTAVGLALGKQYESICNINDKQERKRYRMSNWMRVLFSVVLVMAACIGCWLLLRPFEDTSNFEYDREGLKVKCSNLTTVQKETLKDILDNMVWVKGGNYVMGNFNRIEVEGMNTEQDKYSKNAHMVRLNGFFISKYEVTQIQWSAFMDIADVVKEIGKNKPVDYTSWEQCKAFADSLASLTNLPFSLPTEAQWEYAARDGRSGVDREFFYSGSDDPLAVGWILNPPDSIYIHDVGKKTSNHLGLFDMIGNVSEWCLDDFSPYSSEEQNNPCVAAGGDPKVIRGGDINTGMRLCKVTTRDQWFSGIRREATGLRLVINK